LKFTDEPSPRTWKNWRALMMPGNNQIARMLMAVRLLWLITKDASQVHPKV
jgi:hypothetical protein